MSYQISEQLLKFNRSNEDLIPQGFVIHDTATTGATAQNEHDYFNSGNRSASVHYFCDWTQIIRTIPENEVAWGCGYSGNHLYLQVEMCNPSNHNASQFQEVWNRTIWLVADACKRYGWTIDNIFSHDDMSRVYQETNHTDPIQFLQSYGKSWNDLKNAIALAISGEVIITPSSPIQSASDKPLLRQGDNNQSVGELQILLNKLGYNLVVDNDFGAKTSNAVRDFQSKNSLDVDGIVFLQTWSKLYQNKVVQPIAKVADIPVVKPTIVIPDCVLRFGDKGENVKILQNALNSKDFNCGFADSDFGNMTKNALIDFQSKHPPLDIDGICGKMTWTALLK